MRRVLLAGIAVGTALIAASAVWAQPVDLCDQSASIPPRCVYLPLLARSEPPPTPTATTPPTATTSPSVQPTQTANVVPPTPTATTPALVDPIVNGGFELGPNVGWVTAGGAFIANEPSLARRGSWFGFMGGENDSNEAIRQRVTIPAQAPYLTYWYRALSEEADCSADLGSVFVDPAPDDATFSAVLVKLHNEFCDDREFVNYRPVSIDLRAYAGQRVEITFFFSSDILIDSFWNIDDIAMVPAPLLTQVERADEGDPVAIRERLRELEQANEQHQMTMP
jgi:hypothetical protein